MRRGGGLLHGSERAAARLKGPQVFLVEVKHSLLAPGVDKKHLPGFNPACRPINEYFIAARWKNPAASRDDFVSVVNGVGQKCQRDLSQIADTRDALGPFLG